MEKIEWREELEFIVSQYAKEEIDMADVVLFVYRLLEDNKCVPK